jgi:hypothetical protein
MPNRISLPIFADDLSHTCWTAWAESRVRYVAWPAWSRASARAWRYFSSWPASRPR